METNYDKKETEFVYHGFKHGFSLEYAGDPFVQIRAPNLKFRGVGNKTILWNKVMKEVKAKRFAGPFLTIPFEFYIQSLIGLVPKDGGKDTQLIFHLSYPRKTGKSVNAQIPVDKCSVKYPDFSEAIELCLKEGKSCKIARSDIKVAFRNLGILPRFWKYLIMKAECPLDGKTLFCR